MHFQYDIFLSYKASDEGLSAWVASFKGHLNKVLSQLFNKPISIISASDISSSADVMMATGAFVSIVTPEYLTDSIEQSYLSEFNKLSKGKRIFKVVKEQLPKDKETELLKQLISYDFYHASLANNHKIDQDRFFKTEAERLYWLKVVDLAYAIYNATVPPKEENRIKNLSKTIFVAEVSEDQVKFRDTIVRELQYHGYNILPAKPLPSNKIDFEQSVQDNIQESQLSVHIMGEKYGEILQDDTVSRVEYQNRIAASLSKKKNVDRLIWVSPQLIEFEEKQKIYLEQLKKDIDELEGAELVQTPLEIFKTIIENKLSGKRNSSQKEGKKKTSSKSIYLINGKEDHQQIEALKKWLEDSGYDVLPSVFEGNRADVVETHRHHLAMCDGALVYYAHSNPQWIRMKMQDMVKAPGFGREKPMDFTAIYTTVDEELPPNQNLNDLVYIKQQGNDLNKEGLKEIAIKLS